jgi:hypothetical protein
LDVIIDDGSHASFHQQLMFKHLFPKLRPNGTYVIENLHWQPGEFEQRLMAVPKTGEFFISFLEDGKYVTNTLGRVHAGRQEFSDIVCLVP